MPSLFYLIGIPGSGKSTLFEQVFAGCPIREPIFYPYHAVLPGGIILGKNRPGGYSGTDSLDFWQANKKTYQWLTSADFLYAAVAGEGERLSTRGFFSCLVMAGWRLTVAALDTPIQTAMARIQARGLKVNHRFVTSRITKVQHLRNDWVDPLWVLDGRLPIDELAAQVKKHPVIQRIREGSS